jgi:pimeloyl-ACP methyl ester carboxylesterase
MELTEDFAWRGRRVRWGSRGEGPAVILCHGTPWSSALWEPFADALAAEHSVFVWDMPGYGTSSKEPAHRVSLDIQGELLADLAREWGLRRPHVVAHDYGGAVALRAHLLHDLDVASLALVDVVALSPWGSEFFRLVRDNAPVFTALPPAMHVALLRAYVAGASHVGLTEAQTRMLVEPWSDPVGQAAFYRQIAQADQEYTDEVEPLYGAIDVPVQIVWGAEDTWIPVDRAHRLADLVPGAQLEIVDRAGHLIQLDAPVRLTAILQRWLSGQRGGPTEPRS